MTPEDITKKIEVLRLLLDQLLQSKAYRFDQSIRPILPAEQGVYRIFEQDSPQATLRAGRTRNARGGLRQRVYQNHLMGTQAGNLCAQLVGSKVCADLLDAKRHVQQNLLVQFLRIDDGEVRARLECFMLSVLGPTFWDRNA